MNFVENYSTGVAAKRALPFPIMNDRGRVRNLEPPLATEYLRELLQSTPV